MMPAPVFADRAFLLTCLVGGALVVVGCVLPTIEIGTGAFIGAGNEQVGFDYNRTLRFATYLTPGSLLFPLGGVALVLIALAGLRRGSHPALVLVAAAISAAFLGQLIRIDEELQWADGVGVVGCDAGDLESCAPFVAPGVRDLQRDIRSRPEASRAGFELIDDNGRRARGRSGWPVLIWASIVLAVVTAYRAFLLVLRPAWAGVAVAICVLVVLLYLVAEALESLA
jgi:hypothetical protein